MERPVYSDPITQFLEDLHLHAKFEHAQQRLKNCAQVRDAPGMPCSSCTYSAKLCASQVLDKDFFLSNLEQLFIRSARLSIFETYCRIHERIDLKMLAQNLGRRTAALCL
jgi:translation initiation factor 3 subunit E